ncbi:hypothetical protein [Methanolobus vulcani]|uniref:Uncharacterized protein n=1 Tax=Methanolobus vulcani TaxID=38026 RepID=A0A7Z8KQH3_9EURY|nr:hypothetical protein [Methanolobus vulcani]TQD27932.1 hypothetical protein FKV42_02400 [Methanolobus vulcani]
MKNNVLQGVERILFTVSEFEAYEISKKIYHYICEYFIDKDIRVFFKKYRKENLLFLIPPEDIDPKRSGTTNKDFQGLLTFQSFCHKYKIDTEKAMANYVSETDCEKNILSLAGPIPNEKSRFFFEFDEIKYCFGGERGYSIISKNDNEELYTSEIINDEIKVDYGIITRMKNPYCKENDVIIVAGCLGPGTQAAIESLTKINKVKVLNEQKEYYFQVIVKCKVDSSLRISESEIMTDTFTKLY